MSDKPPSHSSRRSTRCRRVLYFGVTSLLLLVLLEGAVRVGMFFHNRNLSLQMIVTRQQEVAAPAYANDPGVRHEVVHPYVGYVVDPTTEPGVNRYGFLQIDGPILKRRDGLIIVGITGGSVAKELCQRSAATVKRRLQELIGPIEIAVVCLAQDGFHQPQQAMAWSFFQCLGAEFDYFVNLDGFNEVALFQLENDEDDTWYAYPRGWEYRLTDTNNPELNRVIAEGADLRRQRAALAQRFVPFQQLPLMSIHQLWSVLDGSIQRRLLEKTVRLKELNVASQAQYSHTGPAVQFESPAERIESLVDLWSQCSLTLNRVCSAGGMHYLHRLQPNIGIDSSKALTEVERHLADAESPYRQGSRAGYPSLMKRGPALKASGVDFEDLTEIYAAVSDSVYRDDCCHMNQVGNDLLAEALSDSIARHFLNQK